jgi:phosphatidate cytidylyltransferase
MMPRTRRSEVRFPHHHHTRSSNGSTTGSDVRRASFSDANDNDESARDEAGEQVDEVEEEEEEAVTEDKQPTEQDRRAEYEKKKANFWTRTLWTLIMFGGFFWALFMGHIYIIAVVTAVQVVSFKEVIAIASVPIRARQLRSNKSINWYWLGTTMYFLYGESIIYYFKHIVLVDKMLLPLATHHRFISFVLYVFGFVFFVASLQAGNYKFQFTQFAWTHMALYLVVVQAHFILNNIFEGMIWFFVPAALVITNDIFAYLFGITFGRTQLIKLSPKKTVEGFTGAWGATVVFALFLTAACMRSSYFICPVNDFGANVFTGLDCVPNPAFVPHTYRLPHFFFLPQDVQNLTFTVAPIQFHALILATFASLIAPFGGFFASGLKRTFNIKDFGDSIPGHGGITDRMDCQFIMGAFTYVYYHTFIASNRATLGDILEKAITGLTYDQLVELVRGLVRYLVNHRVLKPDAIVELVEYLMGQGVVTTEARVWVTRSLLEALARTGTIPEGVVESFNEGVLVRA